MPDGNLLSKSERSLAEQVATLPENVRAMVIEGLDETELEALRWDWKFWARPKQLEPPGDWDVWMYLAGRGSGKTRTGAEWIRAQVCGSTPLGKGKCGRIALIGETTGDVRDVMVEGESGLLSVHPPGFRPLYEPSKRRLTWPNGAVATCYNGTEPDQLRGPQHDAAWIDELAKLMFMQEVWDQLMFGLRLGLKPRAMATTTPRPMKLIKELVKDDSVFVTPGTTYENASNLAPAFLKTITRKYEGTRLGRQELMAEVIEDNPYALWRQSDLDGNRIGIKELPEFERIVVAVDPPVTSGEDADECGITVSGRCSDRIGYILEDASKRGLTPSQWAERAISRYYKWQADAIVVEVNNGGDLVKATISNVDSTVPIKEVRASRGKVIRAEPVAALYEQGRVRHVGQHTALEDQMCDFTTDFDRKKAGYSPDRLDSLVWGLSHLMLTERSGRPHIRRL